MTRPSETRRFDRLLIVALSLCAACNAPRNNPFDPQNPRSPYVALEGHVQTQSFPRTALTGAAMFWKNGARLAQTDAQGHFRFENLMPENDWLHIEKSGYKKDSVFVLWDGNKQIALDIFLNAMPVMENLQLSTEILHQYFSNQEARLVVKAGISDRDNDVDSVFVRSEKFDLRKALDYDVDDKSYIATLKLFDLKVNDLEELIGEDFLVLVKDLAAD
ncbi:MAG: carboxypeptidase-like regulatory domain-containing protein, partial [bacterium]